MLAIDTNVVVRLLTGDDPVQAEAARALMAANKVLLSSTVLIETAWVLERSKRFTREEVAYALRLLAGLPNVVIEDAERFGLALEWAASGMDFSDAFHLAAAMKCEAFVSFDRRLARAAARCGAPPVRAP